jgi:hypothetical protein
MTREEEIMNDHSLASYVDKQRGWISEAFMDGVIWADENRPVDWQQVRIQAAIAAMQALRSNTGYNQCTPVEIAKFSVTYADALVKELKGEYP